jgi:osmoprotectant transport system permease protein
MAGWSTAFVIGLAVPAGILLTRPRFKRYATPVLTFASSGQAIPAYGLLILFFTWIGTGPWTAIFAFTLYAILPVLRNTIVGLEQVDDAIIEAGRGMGLSKLQVLRRIELPLSVPVILAGIRTALVINVGMAALAVFIGGGGLGETINSGLKLRRDIATFMGAGIVALLALVIDWLAALAERYLRPRGI